MVDVTNIETYAKTLAAAKTQDFLDHPEYWGKNMTLDRLSEYIARAVSYETFMYIEGIDEGEKTEIYTLAKATSKKILKNYYDYPKDKTI